MVVLAADGGDGGISEPPSCRKPDVARTPLRAMGGYNLTLVRTVARAFRLHNQQSPCTLSLNILCMSNNQSL